MPGIVIFEGPSQLDGAPIVVVATDSSKNAKTGDMVQTWILRADVDPVTAGKNGEDSSICGACPHRRNPKTGERSCYVTLFRAPLSVFRAFTRGAYRHATPAEVRAFTRGRMVRLGSYGDPAAVPLAVWRNFVAESAGRTGYTHQWRDMSAQRARAWQRLVMASADTELEALAAQAAGWRTFRVRRASAALMSREVVCPASVEAGHKLACVDCRACAGNDGRRSPGVAIIDHGPGWRRRERLAVVAAA